MSGGYGGPAFPLTGMTVEGTADWPFNGMSLRDYFAAKAMQTLIESWAGSDPKYARDMAGVAYKFADEMLKERDR